MKVKIHAIHFDADQSLVDFIQRKLNKLDTFYDRIINGEVFLKLEGETSAKVHTKLIEIKIHVPNGELFVSEKGKSFEEATDIALESLKIQLKKFKDKKNNVSHEKANVVEIEELDEIEI